MLKRNLAGLLILWLMLFPNGLYGQLAGKWAEKVETGFKTLRPSARKALVDGVRQVIDSDFLTIGEKEALELTFGELQDLQLSVHTELQDYVRSVICFYEKDEKANLRVWLKGLHRVMAGQKRKEIRDYLRLTAPIVLRQAVWEGGTHRWTVKGKLEWKDEGRIEVVFRDADLVCYTRHDSVTLLKTSGVCLPEQMQLKGQGGRVVWTIKAEQVHADLTRYRIDLKKSGYSADSVLFHYQTEHPRPLWGQLRDQAAREVRTESFFPEFISYAADIELQHLYEGIRYRGGISWRGDQLLGTGRPEHLATLDIIPGDSVSLHLQALRFRFDSAQIVSEKAALELRMDSGKITHPEIYFKYRIPEKTVSVKRLSEQSLHRPFKDTYHRILFGVEEIYWPLDGKYIEMKMSGRAGLTQATVESLQYFSKREYDNLQGLDDINPLNGLQKCALALGTATFSMADYSRFRKKSADQLRRQVILLSYSDFVDYDETTDEVTLKARLFDYTGARVEKQDYDNIRFVSAPEKSQPNALLDVRNFNLRIFGVEQIMISGKKKIAMEPREKQLVMMKNRDMSFEGKLRAGIFTMYGTNFFFSYDDYAIDLPQVDSARIFIAGEGELQKQKIGSLIQNIKGKIVIDEPDNKSAQRENPGFPVLHSSNESYVYFDDPSIRHGQYRRDSFYYRIEPYSIHGLDDPGRFSYAFAGTLISNILPPIEDSLRLMDDNVLGLTLQCPEEGYPLYGEGRLFDRIVLNKQGFTAQGKVVVNRCTFYSDTICMLPYRMTAIAEEIFVDSVAAGRPSALGEGAAVEYLPRTGILQATSSAVPFGLYRGQATHEGKLIVSGESLDACGKIAMKGVELQSGLFHLLDGHIHSEHTGVNIASFQDKHVRLMTSDVETHIDMAAAKAKFVNNAASNCIDFASSRYSCSFESFTWYMNQGILNIGVEDSCRLAALWKKGMQEIPPVAGNRFISTDPLADSLGFTAPQVRYDLEKGNIACRGVRYIDLANGRFFPENGEVNIGADGKIRKFVNGKLQCDAADTTKSLTGVKLDLSGRYRFGGEGDYHYVSAEKKETVVRFSEIGVDSSRFIYAKAGIEEERPLRLDDGLKYKGTIILNSARSGLYFSGYAGLAVTDTNFRPHWIKFDAVLHPQHIRIPLQVENLDDKQQRVYNGIYLNADKTFRPYAAFMSNRLFYKDDLLAEGAGWLEWCPALKQYWITDSLKNPAYRFCYDPQNSRIFAYDRIGLDIDIPGVDQKMSGNISYDRTNERLEMKGALCLLDFPVLDKMENIICKDFGAGRPGKGTRSPEVDRKMALIGDLSIRSLPSGQSEGKVMPDAGLPDKLFILDSLCLYWNEPTRSYKADGGVNVVAVCGKPVDREMKVKIEFIRRHSGNQYFMYIYDDKMWYYFEFTDRNLYTLSSDEEYNAIVKSEKADKKVMKNASGESGYTITICPVSKQERFLKRMK